MKKSAKTSTKFSLKLGLVIGLEIFVGAGTGFYLANGPIALANHDYVCSVTTVQKSEVACGNGAWTTWNTTEAPIVTTNDPYTDADGNTVTAQYTVVKNKVCTDVQLDGKAPVTGTSTENVLAN